MTEMLGLFQNILPLNVNKYYIFPSVFGGIVFLLLKYQNPTHDRELPILLSDTFTIFSLTLSTEYLLYFLVLGSLPGELAFADKAIIIIGIICTYLSILSYCAEGTTIGNLSSHFLNKMSTHRVAIEPALNFKNELLGLNEAKNLLMSIKDEENVEAFNKLASNGHSVLTKLKLFSPNGSMEIKEFESKYDECSQNIHNYINSHDEGQKKEACFHLSEFIGKVEGMNSSMEFYITNITVKYQGYAGTNSIKKY